MFILLCITCFPFYFCNRFEEEEKEAGCFAIIVLQMNCYCKCFVTLPHGAVGWSAVCDCGISRTNSHTCFYKFEPVHEISNNMVCATSKASDQPAHTRSLIRAFASRLSIL